MEITKIELSTGIKTECPIRGGRIKVTATKYDTYFNNPSLESEYKAEISEILKRIFKPQTQN